MSDGLSRPPHRPATLTHVTGRGHAWIIGVLISCMVLPTFAGDSARLLLRYERAGVEHGEWWRLISGHFIHGNTSHLLLNLGGTALVALLFGRDYTSGQWLMILLLSLLCIDVAFVFYEPQLQWYVGFSGVLHGVIAAGIVAWWHYENRPLTLALTVLLSAKLVWEQTHGALPFSGDMPVIVDAHLYGAIGGLLGAVLIGLKQRYWPQAVRSL